MKPPGILPADDILSSMSTLRGKIVAPGRGTSERVAVDSTIVSPSLAVTDPPAWRASFPVSSTIERSPTGISKRIFFSPLDFWDLPKLQARGLSAQAELRDERPVALDVLFLQVLEQPATLADHPEQAPARMVVVLVLAQVLRKVRYAPREHRDLHLRRARVALVGPVLPYYLYFVLNCRQLLLSPLSLSVSLSQPIQPYMLPHASDSIVRYPPGLFYVARYLLFELLDPGEPLLLPYPPDEAHVHHTPVEIPLEVEQVGLDAALVSTKGRRHPDVGAGHVPPLPHAHEPGVHAARWDDQCRIG